MSFNAESDPNIKLNLLFPTPVIEVDLPMADQLIEPLRSAIYANKAASKGIMRSNILGWHSDTKMLEWGGDAAAVLAMETMKVCGRYTSDAVAPKGQSRYEMGMEMWANVSPAGASNQLHAHPSSYWSATFYVDDGGDQEDGYFVAQDPRFPTNRMNAADLLFVDDDGHKHGSQHRMAPTPGKLVIFPSWMLHSVRPHNGPRDRISIAMNIIAMHAR